MELGLTGESCRDPQRPDKSYKGGAAALEKLRPAAALPPPPGWETRGNREIVCLVCCSSPTRMVINTQ